MMTHSIMTCTKFFLCRSF